MQVLNRLVPDGTPIHLTDTYGNPFIKEVHNCKYALICPSYDPTLTKQVTVAGRCVNGGGCACSKWKHRTNKQLGGYDKPQTQSATAQPHGVVASVCTVESKAVDSMEQRLKKLSNIKMEEL